jgi:hypothetical protein
LRSRALSKERRVSSTRIGERCISNRPSDTRFRTWPGTLSGKKKALTRIEAASLLVTVAGEAGKDWHARLPRPVTMVSELVPPELHRLDACQDASRNSSEAEGSRTACKLSPVMPRRTSVVGCGFPHRRTDVPR